MKKTFSILLSITMIISLCACSTKDTPLNNSAESEAVQPQSSTQMTTDTSNQVTQDEPLDEPQNNSLMPDPFGDRGMGGGDGNKGFLECFDDKINSISYEFFEHYEEYLGEKEFITELWNGEGSIIPHATGIMTYENVYSLAVINDIPMEIVIKAIDEYNESYIDLIITNFGKIDYEKNSMRYTEADKAALLTQDEETILEHFVTPYAIVIKDKIYTPAWLYTQPIDDYKAAGITPEMIEEKIELYSDFYFTEEAREAFEKKLSEFTNHDITIPNPKTKTNVEEKNDAFKDFDVPSAFNCADYGGNAVFYDAYTSKFYNTGVLKEEFANYLGLSIEDFYTSYVEKFGGDFYTAIYKNDLMETINLYSIIEAYNIPNDVVIEAIKSNNKHYDDLTLKYNDPDYLRIVFSDDDIEAICSRDKAVILKQFATEYSIVVGDKIFSPVWIYSHKIEDYKANNITPEMIEEKLELYSKFKFTKEAKEAFEKKLSNYIEKEIVLNCPKPVNNSDY